MKRSCILICLILTFTACVLNQPAKPPVGNGDNTDSVTIFFSGHELGALKPCGCSGGQLGGLNRRREVFNRVPQEKRLIVDTGTLVKDTDLQDQNRIKFQILIWALNLLQYDLLCLSQKDVEFIKDNFGNTLEFIGSDFSIIEHTGSFDEPVPKKFTKQILLADQIITITIATCDVDSTPIAFIDDLYFSDSDDNPAQTNVNILVISRWEDGIIQEISEKASLVDCLICPAELDKPEIKSEPNQRPLVFSMGRYNRYISTVKIEPENTQKSLRLTFESVAVTEDLKESPDMKVLYENYQELVKDANLLEKYPRFTYQDGLKFEGSYSCFKCHEHEYENIEWMNSAHSNAYETLVEEGSEYDPECIICHVVGMKYDSGFITAKKTPLLKDVGCENCHGPGNLHNKDPKKYKMPIPEPKEKCIECHTPEHSDDYLGHEEEKLQLIMHWTEPNAPADVK